MKQIFFKKLKKFKKIYKKIKKFVKKFEKYFEEIFQKNKYFLRTLKKSLGKFDNILKTYYNT